MLKVELFEADFHILVPRSLFLALHHTLPRQILVVVLRSDRNNFVFGNVATVSYSLDKILEKSDAGTGGS